MAALREIAEGLTRLASRWWKTEEALTRMRPVLVKLYFQDAVYMRSPLYIALPKIDAMLLSASKHMIMLDEDLRHLAPIPVLLLEAETGHAVTACTTPILIIDEALYVPFKPKSELEVTLARLDEDSLEVDPEDTKNFNDLLDKAYMTRFGLRSEKALPDYDYTITAAGRRVVVSTRRGPFRLIRYSIWRVVVDGLAYIVFGDPDGIEKLLRNFSTGARGATFIVDVKTRVLPLKGRAVFLLPLDKNRTLLLRHLPVDYAVYGEHIYYTRSPLLPPYHRAGEVVLGPGSILKAPDHILEKTFRPAVKRAALY